MIQSLPPGLIRCWQKELPGPNRTSDRSGLQGGLSLPHPSRSPGDSRSRGQPCFPSATGTPTEDPVLCPKWNTGYQRLTAILQSPRKAAPIPVQLLFSQPRPPWELTIQLRALSAALDSWITEGRLERADLIGQSLGCVVVAGNWVEMKAPGRDRWVRGSGSEAACCLSNRGRSSSRLQFGRAWSLVEPGHAKDTNLSFFKQAFPD